MIALTTQSFPEFELEVKNYRGFSDAEPLRIHVRAGFTAFVGPNNSGKSSVLRFFYEMRPLFQELKTVGGVHRLFTPDYREFQPLGVEDREELFHDGNSRNLSVSITISAAQGNQVKRVDLSLSRENHMWGGILYVADDLQKIAAISLQPDGTILGHVNGENREIVWAWFQQIFGTLSETLYVGPFRNILVQLGNSPYYDILIGANFTQEWDNWKTGESRARNRAAQRVMEDIARIFGYKRFDASAASPGNSVVRNLQVALDGKPYRLREVGAGLAQFLVVLGNAAFRKPTFLLVDEPELNLHPSLQVDFLTSLASYATAGVLFATHSLGLARSTAQRIYSLQKHDESLKIRSFEQTSNLVEFLGELSFSAFKELGHDLILLVEGVTEVLAVQQFLRLLGVDHRVVIVPLGGGQLINGGVESELSELRRLTARIAVLIDSEKPEADAELAVDRRAFTESCTKLGFQIHVTERRAFENYLPEAAIQAVKGHGYRALAPYERLRDAPLAWGKHENWRIAREMTRDELLATDIGRFLESLFR